MATTVAGGRYLAQDGKTLVNAENEVIGELSKKEQEAAKKEAENQAADTTNTTNKEDAKTTKR
jgi:hypothetical protein